MTIDLALSSADLGLFGIHGLLVGQADRRPRHYVQLSPPPPEARPTNALRPRKVTVRWLEVGCDTVRCLDAGWSHAVTAYFVIIFSFVFFFLWKLVVLCEVKRKLDNP